jgi:hypothetical protein
MVTGTTTIPTGIALTIDGGTNTIILDGTSTSTTTGIQGFIGTDDSTLTLNNLTLQNFNAIAPTPPAPAATIVEQGAGGVVQTTGNFFANNDTFIGNKAAFIGGALSLNGELGCSGGPGAATPPAVLCTGPTDPRIADAIETDIVDSIINSTFANNVADYTTAPTSATAPLGVPQANPSGVTNTPGGGGAIAIGVDEGGFTPGGSTQLVTISQSSFLSNSTAASTAAGAGAVLGFGLGGAILSNNNFPATVNVANSLFLGNIADGTGGAISNFRDTMTITDSQFGGTFPAITLPTGVTVPAGGGNVATHGSGGAVDADSFDGTFIQRDSFVNNSAPGTPVLAGALPLTSQVAGDGGALFVAPQVENNKGALNTLNTVTNSTFFGNSALGSAAGGGGGAIEDQAGTVFAPFAGLEVINSTIAGNTILKGAGLLTGAGLDITTNPAFTVITVPPFPPIGPATAQVISTILSNNSNNAGVATVTNCGVTKPFDLGFNLEFGATSCGFLTTVVSGTHDIVGSDPLLGAPADTGGPNIGATGSTVGPLTMALTIPTSPAIGAVTGTSTPASTQFSTTVTGTLVCSSTGFPFTVAFAVANLDGRSLSRQVPPRTGCDIGAWDSGGSVTPQQTVMGTLVANHTRVGFAANNRPGRQIQYINGNIGGASFKTINVTMSCPHQCTGNSKIGQPGTATVILSGPLATARGFVPALTAGSTATVTEVINTTVDRRSMPQTITRTLVSIDVSVFNSTGGLVADTGVLSPPFAFGSNFFFMPQ